MPALEAWACPATARYCQGVPREPAACAWFWPVGVLWVEVPPAGVELLLAVFELLCVLSGVGVDAVGVPWVVLPVDAVGVWFVVVPDGVAVRLCLAVE